MSRRVNAGRARGGRRWSTILWVAACAIVTIGLIYYQQTALLYILATLGVTALLLIVAMTNLKGTEAMTGESAPADDSAAIGSGLTGTRPAPTRTTRASAGATRASGRSSGRR